MIPRYTLPEIGRIWSEDNKYEIWMAIEILVCEALCKQGKIPAEDLKNIQEGARYSIARINDIERETNHDVIAFLTDLAENVGPSSRYIHYGLTSSDLLDTALAVMCVEATDILLKDLEALLDAIAEKAKQYKDTPMIGRSHGVHAEPITFGLKMALMYEEFKRNVKRLELAREGMAVGQISGAVGTYAHIDPSVEAYVCEKLDLAPAAISTQILQRDRHADYMNVLALIGASVEKYGLEFRNLQRTEILEVEESFSKGQKGSSAMPHKRNPIICERVCGLARILRGNAMAALENVALWHERDITHSSVERVIIPDSTILLHYMLVKMVDIVKNLAVYPDNMMVNLESTNGLIFSQRILLELAKKGLTREESYRIVQRNAMDTWKTKKPFKENIQGDADIKEILSPEEIESCFDLQYHFKHVNRIFKAVGLE